VIFVMGSITVREGGLARMAAPVARQTQVTRGEAGCLHYSLAHDVFDPDVIRVAERWIDQPSLAAHLVSDQMVQFNIDFRAAQILRARVDSFHPGGVVRKLIDVNAIDVRVPRDSKDRVIVMGTLAMGPGEIDRLADALRSQIESTRTEDGCEHYSFARDPIDAGLLHIAERWRDAAALTAHSGAPHMAAFTATLGEADVRAASVKAYDENGERTLMGE
jgi:quinol monooxygenase YgiN